MILWSEEAKMNYLEIIDQLFERWNYKIVIRFQNDINTLIEALSSNPKLCSASEVRFLRKCIVNKHIALIYKLDNGAIYIVSLVYNKAGHIF